MIYLIRSAAFKDKSDSECIEYEPILKIGYTKDDGKKSRFDCYITENPTCQILYQIPKGSEQDERNLHYHFRKYKKDYGQEWFSYEEEILSFFETHTTRESLKELKTYKTWKQKVKLSKERNKMFPILSKKYVSKILSSLEVSSEYLETIDNLINKLYELLEDGICLNEIDNYFKSSYQRINFSEETLLSPEISTEINKIEELSEFTNKMKYIYNFNCEKEFMKLLLDNLTDPSFAKYYYSIPKERAGTLGYQKGNLEKEYNNIKSYNSNSESIIGEIKTRFVIGEKYSKSEIKEILGLIYESNGYNKTPKATELANYFELKECLIPNKITGKRDRGFEILGLKENE